MPTKVKQEPAWNNTVHDGPDLREEIANLKDALAVAQKNMQSQVDSVKSKLQKPAGTSSYNQGQTSANHDATCKCFYCYEIGHRWDVCPVKEQDIKDGKMRLDGRQLRFANGNPIPREEGMSIKAIVEKYMPSSMLVCLGIMPELPQDDLDVIVRPARS